MHKYARVECERRFLVADFPSGARFVRTRHIVDGYIEGTTLRLREQRDDAGPAILKLTQKIAAREAEGRENLVTTIHLAEEEFRLLQQLPAKMLRKTRYSLPPFGIDVFEDSLSGLVLAEAEFDSPEASDGLAIPTFVSAEVSGDDRFTGGRLVRASREDLRSCLMEYGIQLP